MIKVDIKVRIRENIQMSEYYKGSNLIGYRVPGGFWVNFFHKKPLIQP